LPNCNAALQQEGADLIDDAGTLTNQTLPHAVQRLQVELLGGLGRDANNLTPVPDLSVCQPAPDARQPGLPFARHASRAVIVAQLNEPGD
jgi:hypothetical protein